MILVVVNCSCWYTYVVCLNGILLAVQASFHTAISWLNHSKVISIPYHALPPGNLHA